MEAETTDKSHYDAGGSLWIDFLLQPSKLDEHLASLAAGTATDPSYIDLIVMFLERAILSYRGPPSNKKLEVAVSVCNAEGKSAMLCGLAAKVWMTSDLCLADIESIPSVQCQFLLLKALVKYDKANTVLHQCKLHQWVLHNLLKAGAVRTAFLSSAFPISLPRGSFSGENNLDMPVADADNIVMDSESDSIAFIEAVLGLHHTEEDNVEQHDWVTPSTSKSSSSKINYGITQSISLILDDNYKCELQMDLGEVYFMRGRILKAHELFCTCGKLLEGIPMQPKSLWHGQVLISRERLAGFIIACRMVLGRQLFKMKDGKTDLQELSMDRPPLEFLNSPSSAHCAIISCEQSRWVLRSMISSMRWSLQQVDGLLLSLRKSESIEVKANRIFCLLRESMATDASSHEHILLQDLSQQFLIDILVHDLFHGHLTWGYRLSLEKNHFISPFVRSFLMVCDALHSIIIGCPLESFLRVSANVASNIEAVHFLLKMIAACMKGQLIDHVHGADECESTISSSIKRRRLSEISRELLNSQFYKFVKYICCVIDKSWCWDLARDLHLLNEEDIRVLQGGILTKCRLERCAVEQVENVSGKCSEPDNSATFFHLLQAETVNDYEAFFKQGNSLFSRELIATEFDRLQVNETESSLLIVEISRKCRTSILLQKACDAIVSGNQYELAKYLSSQALLQDPDNVDVNLIYWLCCKLTNNHNALNMKLAQANNFPSSKVVAVTLQNLINEELWDNVQEMCILLNSFNDRITNIVKNQQDLKMEMKKMILLGKVAKDVGNLCSFCSTNEKALSSVAGGLLCCSLEVFLCHIFDVGRENDLPVSPPSMTMMPFILSISNLNVIKCIIILTAGWLQRCYIAGLTPWPLDIERYGIFAKILAGTSIASTAGSSTNMSLRISLDSVRSLLQMLLERVVDNTNALEFDKEKGHIWLQGMADLAYEKNDHLQAMKRYLQAGAIRSGCYCDRSSSMPRDIFTSWIISRMIASCRALGANLQAIILCQCLPVPNLDLAFQILQENIPTTIENDLDLYAEYIWEVPILELLVHLLSKSGNAALVSALTTVIQQPALNVYNPSNVRKYYIQEKQMRFLQQLYDEII